MRKRSGARRGIFIISVLFIVVLVSMFVGAAFELTPWAFRRVANQAELAAAHRAARSGMEYAVARLRANPDWKARDLKEIVEPGLYIREEGGNVVGIISEVNGLTSQFRLRFNYQDGSFIRDGLDDPPAPMTMHLPLVSVNNVKSNRAFIVPKADTSGVFPVADPAPVHAQIPPHSVFLVCEGRTGDFLRQASPTNPNPTPAALGTVSTARVETLYKLEWDFGLGTPAVAAAAGRFAAEVPNYLTMDMTDSGNNKLNLDSADSSIMGRLRTRKDLSVLGQSASGEKNLTAGTGKQGEFRHTAALGTAAVQKSANIAEKAEVTTDPMVVITWDKVRKAADTGTNKIRAGTYTVWADGSTHYYDLSLKDYKTAIKANPTLAGVTPAPLPSSVTYDSTKKTFTVTKDTLIDATGTTTKDLTIIPKKGADGGPDASGAAAEAPSASEMKAALNTPSADVVPVGGGMFNYTGTMSTLIYNAVGNLTGGTPPTDYTPSGNGGWTVSNIVSGGTVSVNQTSQRAKNEFSAMLARYIEATLATNPTDPAVGAALSSIGFVGGGLFSEVAGETDTARPQDLAVNFAPSGTDSSAVLTGPGNVTLGAKVVGEGGSITAEGDINLIGLGVTMAASKNPNEGVSLYSKENVLISTYDKSTGSYHDVGLKGVVYCWGHFKAVLGDDAILAAKSWGQFSLNGSLIAYGKDPTDPDAEYRGDVKIQAERAGLKFDSSYLFNALDPNDPDAWTKLKFGRVWWMQQ